MQEYSTFTDSFIAQVTEFFYNPPCLLCLKIMATDLAHFMFFRERRTERVRERELEKIFCCVRSYSGTNPLGPRSAQVRPSSPSLQFYPTILTIRSGREAVGVVTLGII